MLSQEIRRHFLDYFRARNHAVVSSSPVVPHDDPTLLFTNAGMNQFKDVFLGQSKRDYTRATTSQKCIRVGGKHNDLENVGHTSRHLTMFEMIGNFSFGDYFKKEAIQFAWEVSTEIFKLEADKIWPTVFREDDEAFELWKAYVPEDRITRFNEDENYWAMGDTGPCGPCSELLYDRGADYGSGSRPSEDPSGERFLEFWNLVFMQNNRDASGTMNALPRPSIDTGGGLERIVSLKMGVESVFETDIMRALIEQVEEISGVKYDQQHESSSAFRVISDHIRCLSFCIADGVQPSNVDRGYVLRKVLRRAVRYGRSLGINEPFLARVLPRLLDTMGDDFVELRSAKDRITEILTLEEEAFQRTLQRGGNLLNQVIRTAHKSGNNISGDDAFKLKDTYGLPLEEIQLIAKDTECTVDLDRYKELEIEAKERSRGARKETHQIADESLFRTFVAENGKSEFVGFNESVSESVTITGITVDGEFVDTLNEGQEGSIVLTKTPFYAEMGGQVGDRGTLTGADSQFTVSDTQGPYKDVITHSGTHERGTLKVGDSVTASIDTARRARIQNNHTATHLLHWALHQVLGEHVRQAGSVVEPGRLRFDFSHHKAMTPEQIREVEDVVNEKIRMNQPVEWYEISYDDAQKDTGIKQFFGDKYGSTVRVVDIDFSKELCGGTHVDRIGNIGLFRIAKESSIAAGVRRIEAVTGADAEALSREDEDQLLALAATLKTQPPKLSERINRLVEENKQLQQEIKQIRKKESLQMAGSLLEQKEEINGISFLAVQTELDPKDLKDFADNLMEKLGQGVLVIAVDAGERVQLLVRVSSDCVSKGVKAGDIIKTIAPFVDGKGGGRPDNAQAGGTKPAGIPEALAAARAQINLEPATSEKKK